MLRNVSAILDVKPVQTALLFGALALVSQLIPAPWWEGPLLSVRPELPDPSGAFVAAPDQRETVKQELAQVDLDAVAETTATVSAPKLAMSLPPGAADPVRSRVACSPTSAAAEPDAADREARDVLPSFRDLELRETIRELDRKLDPPPTELERPCLEWYPSFLTSGFGPVCERRALDGFFEQLREVALEEAHRPVRLSQLGDSLVAGDAFTGELRRLLQDQFGDGGFGFLHVGEASPHVGTTNLTAETSSQWAVRDVVWEPNSEHKFGLAGVSFLAEGAPSLGVYPHDSGHGRTFDRVGFLFYRRRSEVSLRLDVDGEERSVDLSGPAGRNDIRWVEIGPGPHDLRVSGFDRSAYTYGVVLENAGPGVVVDNLGLSSGRAPRYRFIDDEQWRAQIRLRNPDVMSFAFGVNSAGQHRAADSWLEEYRDEYVEILETARSASDDGECMVISLLTRGEREDGRMEIYDSVRPLVRYQREAALRADCGFWNAFEAMGGLEGARRWFDNRPQLLGSDLAHPTRAGYRKLANLFYASLIRQFRRYLDERIRRSTTPQYEDADAPGDDETPPRTPLETLRRAR